MKMLIVLFAVIFQIYLAGSMATSNDPSEDSNVNAINLVSMLNQSVSYQSEVYSQAVKLVNSYQAGPSCHRLAGAKLLSSCRDFTIGEHDEATDALDQTKSTFAARLAVCELREAHVEVPPHCQAMMPVKAKDEKSRMKCLLPGNLCQDDKKGFLKSHHFLDVGRKELKLCLATLESKPQWWTSYSNARQNAFAMCHAMRTEVEKAELLDLHKSLISINSNASDSLFNHTKQANDHLRQAKAFAEAVQKLQEDIIIDMNKTESKYKTLLQDFLHQAQSTFGALIDQLSSKTKITKAQVDQLNSQISNSVSAAESGSRRIQELFQKILNDSNALALRAQQDWESNNQQVTAMHKSLENIPAEKAQSAILLDSSLEKQQNFEETFSSLETKFETLKNGTLLLEENLSTQVSYQNQIFAAFKARIENSQALLNESISQMIEKVEKATHDATTEIEAFGTGVGGRYTKWIQIIVGTLALAAINTNAAMAFIVIMVGLPHNAQAFLFIFKAVALHLTGHASVQEMSAMFSKACLIYSTGVAAMLLLVYLVLFVSIFWVDRSCDEEKDSFIDPTPGTPAPLESVVVLIDPEDPVLPLLENIDFDRKHGTNCSGMMPTNDKNTHKSWYGAHQHSMLD